jgi:hypothetical protein
MAVTLTQDTNTFDLSKSQVKGAYVQNDVATIFPRQYHVDSGLELLADVFTKREQQIMTRVDMKLSQRGEHW